eukprot:3966428-Pyramimonas_sp.AAC.1
MGPWPDWRARRGPSARPPRPDRAGAGAPSPQRVRLERKERACPVISAEEEAQTFLATLGVQDLREDEVLSLIHISEPTRPEPI